MIPSYGVKNGERTGNVYYPVFLATAHTPVCNWYRNLQFWEDDYWESDCGIAWVMNDGSPFENGMNYCPSCGRRLGEKYG